MTEGFTLAQLQVLRRQIDALAGLSASLRALKYRVRTGADLVVVASHFAPSRKTGKAAAKPRGGRSGGGRSGGGGGKSAGRAVGQDSVKKRRKRDEASETSKSEEELSDEETAGESGSESAEFEVASDADDAGPEGAPKNGKAASHRNVPARQIPQRRAAAAVKSLAEDGDESGEEGSDDDAVAAVPAGLSKSGSKSKQVVRPHGKARVAVSLRSYQPVRVVWGEGDDAACTVCGDDEEADDNAILLCEGSGCSVAVHQRCIGLQKMPKGRWVCDGCKAGLGPEGAHCCVCPVVGGALRAVKTLGQVGAAPISATAAPTSMPGSKKRKGGNAPSCMVHLACALWTPEISLGDPERMAAVSLAGLSAARQALPCMLCKQAGGAVVQCSYGSCCAAAHVLCSRAAGNLLTFRLTDGEPLQFCAVHSKERFAAQRDALCEGRAGGGEGAGVEEEEVPPAEPAALVHYELEREANIRRIEAAKHTIFEGP